MGSRKDGVASPLWQLVPVGGIGLYLILYGVAAALYPGGSPVDKASRGFSWLHNYWCNLLNTNAINGQHNTARPVALAAMAILCLSLLAFWYYLPGLFDFGRVAATIIRTTGILAMVAASLLFTEQHDLVINIAGLLSLVALTRTFVGLYKSRRYKLLCLGVLCLLLIAVNNYVYYTTAYLYSLPVIQKLTLVVVLIWIILLDIEVYRRQQTNRLSNS